MSSEEFISAYCSQLNKQQLEAVMAVDGPVLILAVPGSGKTTVMVARIGYLILCKGMAPDKILALSYTVASARDLERRFVARFGEELGSLVTFRTINSLAVNVMNYYAGTFNRNPWPLADEKQTAQILVDIFRRIENGIPTENDISSIRQQISYIKNSMLTKQEISSLKSDYSIDKIYTEYQTAMQQMRIMDFDDQLITAHKIFTLRPEILEYFQNRFSCLCVDETQDSSKIQHALFALLSGKHHRICEVGDEDQSIYGFRGACPEALLRFEEDYPGARVMLMEKNYRSNAAIVSAADRFVQKNVNRHPKTMKAVREAGSPVREIRLKGRSAQYTYILKVAENCEEETAVLYRNNESAVPLVDLLERSNYPYRFRGRDISFFTNRVVADIERILEFSLDPGNVDLFLQIYYKINTYISKNDALRLADMSRRTGVAPLQIALESDLLQERTKASVGRCMSLLRQMPEMEPGKAITLILGLLGYEDYLSRMGLDSSRAYVLRTIAYREQTVRGFLKRMEELQTIMAEKAGETGAKLVLSTIHASKGLEYKKVYILDAVDGIFPDRTLRDYRNAEQADIDHYEEERRIFYVAMTRAKDELNIFTFGEPASFPSEIFGEAEKEKLSANRPEINSGKKSVNKHAFDEKAYRELKKSLNPGMKLYHPDFGKGLIKNIEDDRIILDFQGTERVFSLRILFEKDLIQQ